MAHWFETFGLLANIVGAVMLAVWGLPQPDFAEDRGLSVGPVPNVDEVRRQKRRHLVLSWCGVGMLVLGFVLQLVGSWT